MTGTAAGWVRRWGASGWTLVWTALLLADLQPLASPATEWPALSGWPVDKVAHALVFAVGVWLWRRWSADWGASSARRGWGSAVWILIAAAWGGGVELVQPLVGRHAEWGDLLADVVGAAVGSIVPPGSGPRNGAGSL